LGIQFGRSPFEKSVHSFLHGFGAKTRWCWKGCHNGQTVTVEEGEVNLQAAVGYHYQISEV
jgi:hypothetical protein